MVRHHETVVGMPKAYQGLDTHNLFIVDGYLWLIVKLEPILC